MSTLIFHVFSYMPKINSNHRASLFNGAMFKHTILHYITVTSLRMSVQRKQFDLYFLSEVFQLPT